MNIELTYNDLNKKDTLELLTKFAYASINHYEQKIIETNSLKDTKYSKSKIIELQKKLYEITNHLQKNTETIASKSIITITIKS